MEKRIQLSDHFTYGRLLRFTFPSIVMMIFTSLYSLVDGFFVSNFVGKTAFAAVNLTMPVFTIVGSLGMMIGSGGTAIVGKTLGEREEKKASEYFSMLIYVIFVIGVGAAVLGWAMIGPLSARLGAEGRMLSDCILYGRICAVAAPFFILQYCMQPFFVTAEKPELGLGLTVLGGVLNIVLDALFIAGFHWGLFGAALATSLSQVIAMTLALLYFALPNDSLLQLTPHTRLYGGVIRKACTNGSSEMVGNLAFSLVSILYNVQLLRLHGEDGVAAYGVLMYLGFIFSAVFYGYAMGCAPVVSFHFGARDQGELKNLFRRSLVLTSIAGLFMWLASVLSARVLAGIFVGYDGKLYALTCYAIRIYSISFFFMGISAFGSSFFTALNDGAVSAAISFLRAFLFEIGAILLLPVLMGPDGIWWATVVSELAALLLTVCFFLTKRKKYGFA